MNRVAPLLLTALALTAACRRESPAADAGLADGLPWLFAHYEDDEEDVADMLRAMEERTYLTLDLDGGVVPRSLEPDLLSEASLEGLEHPGRDLTAALPMAVAYLSEFAGEDHADIVLMPSQVPVEPYSPDLYDRTFLEGESCWVEHGCTHIRTENDLIKKNTLMEVRYQMRKDFRWIDMSTDETPRWATMARSWVEESASGEGGKTTIQQAFTIEFTIPRDGRGLRLEDVEVPAGSPADLDSDGTGTLRLQALWSETTFEGFDFGDDMVKGTIRAGIDKNYRAADDFLAETE